MKYYFIVFGNKLDLFKATFSIINTVYDVSTGTSTSTVSQSAVPSGLGYVMAVANNYADRINRVINGPDPTKPNAQVSTQKKTFLHCH
jgi:hypothetical protein